MFQGGAAQTSLAAFDDFFAESFVFANYAANARTASTKAFGNGVNHNYVVVQFRHGTEAAISTVVNKFTINFVSDESKVVFNNKASNHFHFFFGVNNASGVTGVGEQDCLSFRSDVCFDFCFAGQMVAVFYTGLYCVDNSAKFFSEGGVVSVVGFKYHDFVARVAQRHSCEDKCFTTTVGNEDVFQIIVNAFFCIVFLNCFNQNGIAFGVAISDNFCLVVTDAFHKLSRSCDVRLTNIQMINFFTCCLCRVCIGSQLSNRRCR